ncbi:hypothetical protein [Flavobacterium sp. SM2513]|uniref:hypothetical protein n=1 Tax=Flavobacterium sp. SM2513 TaxID=3424766 RepID=UPI003D7F45AE
MEQIGYQKSQGEIRFPHLGGLIKRRMKERRVTNSEMARKMGVTSQTFGSYLKNESLQFRILWEAGLALEYNFLADLMADLPEKVLNSAASKFQDVILAQAEEIKDLKKEVAILKEVLKG